MIVVVHARTSSRLRETLGSSVVSPERCLSRLARTFAENGTYPGAAPCLAHVRCHYSRVAATCLHDRWIDGFYNIPRRFPPSYILGGLTHACTRARFTYPCILCTQFNISYAISTQYLVVGRVRDVSCPCFRITENRYLTIITVFLPF